MDSGHISDAEKAMFLGTMLLGAVLTFDPDAQIEGEAHDGDLVCAIRIDEKKLDIARRCFQREGDKASADTFTELIVGWATDDQDNVYISWEVKNPLAIAGVKAIYGKEQPGAQPQGNSTG